MKFIKEYNDDGYRIYEYQCENEDCDKEPYLKIHVCNNCESSWDEWEE